MLTHTKTRSVAHAGAQATRMLRSYPVAKYIEAMQHETISDTIMCLDELKEDLTVQIRGYDWLFEGYVSWELTDEGRIAFCSALERVPQRLWRYVIGHTYHEECEGYELHLREYPGRESDKNKARELLAKMQGGLIDRKEHTVKAVSAHKDIEDMTPDELAAFYKQTMHNED
jgi:hypothetical protein